MAGIICIGGGVLGADTMHEFTSNIRKVIEKYLPKNNWEFRLDIEKNPPFIQLCHLRPSRKIIIND